MSVSESHLSPRERLIIREAMERAIASLRLRNEKMTATALASATGCNESTVKAYLSGRRRPSVTFVRDLANYAKVPVSELFVALGWMPAHEARPPDAMGVAESIATLAATVGRLEPHVRHVLDATYMTAPAPLTAAAALLADFDGASRFDVRLFKVVSGGRYRAVTNGCAEFMLKSGQVALSFDALERLARQAGLPWRPSAADIADNPDHAAVQLELRCRTYSALRDADIGQFTWQGEPHTKTWADHASRWPAHLLVQDPFGGVSQPGRSESWRPRTARTIVMVGARYSAAMAAAVVAEALGWQFVPVRSDIEVTSGGRTFPVAREPLSGRVLAWSSVARHIAQRSEAGDPWPAVVLLRPSALSGRDEMDRFAVDLLRDTPAAVVYARPGRSLLAWWTTRQVGTATPGQFDGAQWHARTKAELCAVEQAIGGRDRRHDLYLAPDSPDLSVPPGAEIPEWVMDSQASIAWNVINWLNGTANQGQPSLLGQLRPGTLANWLPLLLSDPGAQIPRLDLA